MLSSGSTAEKGEEVGNVELAGDEDDAEVSLTDAVPHQPMETHVQGLGHFHGDGVSGESNDDLVVTEYGCRGLRITHVLQYLTLVGGNASGGEDPAHSASATKEHTTDACGVGGDGVVEWGVVAVVAEEMVAFRCTAGLGSGKV